MAQLKLKTSILMICNTRLLKSSYFNYLKNVSSRNYLSGNVRLCLKQRGEQEIMRLPLLRSNNNRLLSTEGSNKSTSELSGNIKMKVLDLYMQYIQRFETIFENRLPKLFQMYKHFKIGSYEFMSDVKKYLFMLGSLWSGSSLSSFPRQDLEIYRQVPEDMRQLIPLFVISFIPLTIYALLPLAYYYPSHLLSRQFWTVDQFSSFQVVRHNKSLTHYPALVTSLQKCSQHLSGESRANLDTVVNKVKESHNASLDDIISLRAIFSTEKLQVENLSLSHQRHIARSLHLHVPSIRRGALILHYIDHALAREGLGTLSREDMSKACFWRGLNPVELSRASQEHYLSQWLEVSKHLDESNISLLLHCHVLLSFDRLTPDRSTDSMKQDTQL